MVNFKEIYHFSRFQRGSNIFQGGGVQHFPGGGGGPTFSSCLFPIETHITCDFPGGSGPPDPPPSGFALDYHEAHEYVGPFSHGFHIDRTHYKYSAARAFLSESIRILR